MDKNSAKQQGFTIVEVMVVLGISGVIFLLIFIAIPTLQYAGRNNQRKQDVNQVLSAISRYQLNNGAEYPTAARNALDPAVTDKYFLGSKKLSFYVYDADNINVQSLGSVASALSPLTNADDMKVYNYAKCNSSGGATSNAADYRDVVALYAIENRNATISKCQQL